MRTKQCVHVLTGHTTTVADVKCQEADPQVITASMDSTIRLWDLAAGKTLAHLTHHKKSVRGLAIHPTEFSFASASADNIKSWKCPEGNFIQNFEGHNAIVNTLAINSDGVMVSGGVYFYVPSCVCSWLLSMRGAENEIEYNMISSGCADFGYGSAYIHPSHRNLRSLSNPPYHQAITARWLSGTGILATSFNRSTHSCNPARSIPRPASLQLRSIKLALALLLVRPTRRSRCGARMKTQ